jgi:L-arabinose isomerase
VMPSQLAPLRPSDSASRSTANLVLMGHDGPGHPGVALGKLKIRPLKVYHGKVGRGLSIEMSVKPGPITMFSIVEDGGRGFQLLAAQGECVPGDSLKIGNTNSFYQFSPGACSFIEQWNVHGPAHHCAIGAGHVAGQLAKIARLRCLNFVKIC